MYKTFKIILSKLVSKKTIFKFESQLRFFLYIFYIGNKKKCNICQTKLRKFISINHDLVCPRCGSLSRTRRLKSIIDTYFHDTQLMILDFSPNRSFYKYFKKEHPNYLASDLSGDFFSDVSYNLLDLPVPPNYYDLIICYHILEHIENDTKAIAELYRILKNGGTCIIQTPFKEGDSYENEQIVNPDERKIHFGQEDHVRIYSVNGLFIKLQQIGFEVEIITFNDKTDSFYGFTNQETILIAKKN